MIYAVFGNDFDRARNKAEELLTSLRVKKPDASLVRVTEENVSENLLQELMQVQGLFAEKSIVFLDRVLDTKVGKEILLSQLKEMKESVNIFILLEKNLDAKTKEKIEKSAEKVQEYSIKEEKKAPTFSIFTLTDAYAAKDKKATWLSYQAARESGAEEEQIHGILFWQIKNIQLAKRTKSAADAGLNPYVFSKASLATKKFSDEEVERGIVQLSDMYHAARRGEIDFEAELERFLLTAF